MVKDYARLCASLQEIDVFKVVLVDNCKTEFEKLIDKHIQMKSRHQEFFMSMTRGVVRPTDFVFYANASFRFVHEIHFSTFSQLLNDEPSDIEEENRLRCGTVRLCRFVNVVSNCTTERLSHVLKCWCSLFSFIGELSLLKVLTSKAVCRCIDVLLTSNDDFSLDCLCALLNTCGKQLEESLRKKVIIDSNFLYRNRRISYWLLFFFHFREAKRWIFILAALI